MSSPPSPERIHQHVQDIRMAGYTVLDESLPEATITAMLSAFDPLLEAKRATEPPNRGANRFQMDLPFEPPFADPLLYAHPTVLAIVEALFGPDYICTYFASDTPFPGAEYQKVHLDCRLPFPESPYGVPTYSVVLNVPLVDYTEDNGPLEIWPGGTHMIAQPEDMERLAAMMPSVRLKLKAGNLLLRDARLWHRGTPNTGSRSRPNLAVVYSRGWFRFEYHPRRIQIPRTTFEGFSQPLKQMFRYCAILNPDGTISDVE
ncbi:MAG: phytanoyl-CoA dioxygenase family protein [Chloroherpetonaceae bacterium]|nr:phytanoyl-CoA dioxygenase family protein [Chthonomonadaceae bacterium]MDW8207131.1 phytanoyl-CoA dioxygenase family protein [Chloroherpetonaceae bacterium]